MERPKLWMWAVSGLCLLLAVLALCGGVKSFGVSLNPQGAAVEAARTPPRAFDVRGRRRLVVQEVPMQLRLGDSEDAESNALPTPPQRGETAEERFEEIFANSWVRGGYALCGVALSIAAVVLLLGTVKLMAFRFSGVSMLRAALRAQMLLGWVGLVSLFFSWASSAAPGLNVVAVLAFAPAIPLLILGLSDKSNLDGYRAPSGPLWIWVVAAICTLIALLSLWQGVQGLRTALDPHAAFAPIGADLRAGMPPASTESDARIQRMEQEFKQVEAFLTSRPMRMWSAGSSLAALIAGTALLIGIVKLLTRRLAGVKLLRAGLVVQLLIGWAGFLLFAGCCLAYVSLPDGMARVDTIFAMMLGVAVLFGVIAFLLSLPTIPLVILWRADKSTLH